ncbi:MAG TPA: hypothetical protein VH419_16330 [Nocardioidaceae bacterium]
MRSNGITAPAYTPVADLDPRVADALLGELKQRGVAAYTKPVESSSIPGLDRPEFRVSALDRLYVDARESEQVKALITAHDPGLVTSSDDLTWAQIVAGFDQPMATQEHPWPVREDVGRSGGDDHGSVNADADGGTELRQWLSRRDATWTEDEPGDGFGETVARGTRRHDQEAGDDAGDRFVPDPPPPLPHLEPLQQLAWVGLIGGPLLLLAAVLFSISLPTWVALLAVAGFVGGFVTLVATMEDKSGSEDDPENGAVV